MNTTKLFGFVLLVVLFSSIAVAEMTVLPAETQNTFELQKVLISTADVSIPSCTPTEYIVQITNNNNVPIRVGLSQDDAFASVKPAWVTFTDTLVTIPALSTQRISLFINPACQTSGTFALKLAYDINGIAVETKNEVEITHTNNIFLAVTKGFAQACPCEALSYDVEVTNTGAFTDTFTVLAPGATIQPYIFPLAPGKIQKVHATIAYACEEYGNVTIPITVESKANGFSAKTTVAGTINQCYDFSIQGPETISACALGEPVVTKYTITNNQAFENSYDISLKANQATLSGTYIELAGKQTGEFNIIVNPTKAQSINGTLTVATGIGDVAAQKPINITINSCYDLSVDVSLADAEKGAIQLCPGDSNYTFYITNNGTFTEKVAYTLETSRPINATISAAESLAKGTTNEATLIFNELPAQDFTAKVTAQLQNNSRVQDTLTLKFDRVSNKTCFAVSVEPNMISLNATETVANITITSNGLRTATYALNYTSEEYATNTQSVTLSPGESTSIVTYQKTNETSIYSSAPLFLTTQGATYKESITVLKDFPWIWIILAIIILILLILFIILLIRELKRNKKPVEKKTRFKEYKEKKQRRNWWKWLLLILLILLLLLGIWFGATHLPAAGNETVKNTSNTTKINLTVSNSTNITVTPTVNITNQTTANKTKVNKTIVIDQNKEAIKAALAKKNAAGNNQSQYIIVYQNSSKKLNMSELFYDANNDPLTFKVKKADNITFSINNSILTITPDAGFYGVRNTTFVATDSDGLSGSSPEITVIVRFERNFYEAHTIAVWSSIIGILLIIFLLLLFLR